MDSTIAHGPITATAPVRFAIVMICMSLFIADAAFGQFGRPQQQQRTAADYVSVQLLADTAAIQPGETFHVLAFFEIQDNWHIYWKNPGDGAAATSIDLNLPDGFELGEVRWPRPKRTESVFGDVFMHTGDVVIFFPVTAPTELADEPVTFSARMNFAVCDDRMCLFGDMSRELTVPIGHGDDGGSQAAPAQSADVIARHFENLPKLLGEIESGEVALRNRAQQLVVAGPIDDATRDSDDIFFYPHDSPGVDYTVAEIVVNDDRFTVTIDLDVQPHNFTSGPPEIGGLIVFGDEPDQPSFEFALPLPEKAVAGD